MFRAFCEIVWVSVLVSAVVSYLAGLSLYFARYQPGAPFGLFMPEVIVGTMLTGAVIGVLHGIILFFLRRKSLVFGAVACGLFDFSLACAVATSERTGLHPNSLSFYAIGSAVSLLQGATVGAIVVYALKRFGNVTLREAKS